MRFPRALAGRFVPAGCARAGACCGAALALMIGAQGCSSKPASVGAKTSPANATDAAPGDGERAVATLSSNSSSKTSSEPLKTADAGITQTSGAAPENERPPARRIVIFTPGGPLLVDVRITLGGEPLDAAWKNLVADAAEQTDREIENSGKQPAADPAATADGAAIKPLVLRTSRAFVPDPRARSLVWSALDADADGRLSTDEMTRAAERLWLRDANDDRVISASELATLRDQLDGNTAGAMAGARSGGPASARLAAIELGSRLNLERLDFVLQDLYAPLQDLSPDSFADLPRLFGELDADDDGLVVRDELAGLQRIAATLDLQIDFPVARTAKTNEQRSPPTPSLARPTMSVLRADDVIQGAPVPTSDRAALALGKTRLVFSAHDLAGEETASTEATPASPSARSRLERAQIRLMVHDRGDALFDALDVNLDGRLGEREIAAAPDRLAERDADADGNVSQSEAPYQMTIAFLRHEPANAPQFSAPPPSSGAEGQITVAPPRWFSAADLNGDGDVSRREFLGTAEQFGRLDADRDGFVAASEASAAAPTRPRSSAPHGDPAP